MKLLIVMLKRNANSQSTKKIISFLSNDLLILDKIAGHKLPREFFYCLYPIK